MDAESNAAKMGRLTDESIERMLSLAFAPVEPPARLYKRLEQLEDSLERTVEAARDELAEWELKAMSDPRNWVKPAVALAAGGAAAGALVVLGMRSRRRDDKAAEAVRALSDALGDVLGEVERSARRSARRVIP
jgi:hypothetical protein